MANIQPLVRAASSLELDDLKTVGAALLAEIAIRLAMAHPQDHIQRFQQFYDELRVVARKASGCSLH